MTVPYAFANASVSLPLSQLDSNFNTPIIIGNTAVQLGNTVTTLNNLTLANVTVIANPASPITANGGGTGLTSPGLAGNVLTSNGNVWISSAGGGGNGGGVSSISFGSTGLTPSTATTGVVSVAGTLVVGNGGTGLSSLTANSVMLGNGSSSVQFVAPGNSGNVLTSNGTVWLSSVATSSGITSGTVQTTPFATPQYADFTGIPSGVKRITVMFNEISTNGTSGVIAQIGSGSVVTSGYISTTVRIANDSSTSGGSITNGFYVNPGYTTSYNDKVSGLLVLTLISGTTWVASMCGKISTVVVLSGGGVSPSLSGALDRIRITTAGGSDSFDFGSVNILYE